MTENIDSDYQYQSLDEALDAIAEYLIDYLETHLKESVGSLGKVREFLHPEDSLVSMYNDMGVPSLPTSGEILEDKTLRLDQWTVGMATIVDEEFELFTNPTIEECVINGLVQARAFFLILWASQGYETAVARLKIEIRGRFIEHMAQHHEIVNEFLINLSSTERKYFEALSSKYRDKKIEPDDDLTRFVNASRSVISDYFPGIEPKIVDRMISSRLEADDNTAELNIVDIFADVNEQSWEKLKLFLKDPLNIDRFIEALLGAYKQ